MHPAFAVDHRHLAHAHGVGAAGMVGGFGVLAHVSVKLGIALRRFSRRDFSACVGLERRLAHDFARDADAGAEFRPILLGGHVVEQDAGVLVRVFGAQVHAAARPGRAHGAHVGLEAVDLDRVAAVVVDGHGQEVVLDVGPVERVRGADETARLKVVGGTDAAVEEQPLCADGGLVPPFQRTHHRHGLQAFVLLVDLEVVLQVGHPHRAGRAPPECPATSAGATDRRPSAAGSGATQWRPSTTALRVWRGRSRSDP